MEKGESLIVVRPGLRIWIADKFGKVRSVELLVHSDCCLQ